MGCPALFADEAFSVSCAHGFPATSLCLESRFIGEPSGDGGLQGVGCFLAGERAVADQGWGVGRARGRLHGLEYLQRGCRIRDGDVVVAMNLARAAAEYPPTHDPIEDFDPLRPGQFD